MKLIDADALIESLYDYAISDQDREFAEKVKYALNKQPTIEPERNKGKWRHYEGQWICEVCHAELDESSPFCPMCGADMRGEHE